MIVSGVSLAMACICWAKVVGMEKSTHQIAWMPLESEKGKALEGEELTKNMTKALSEERFEKEYI
jgi:hypothetical protein